MSPQATRSAVLATVDQCCPRHRRVALDMRGFGETTYEREDGWSPVGDALAVIEAGLRRLDGPGAQEGRVGGAVRELFLDMNARALRAQDPGEQAEIPPAWPRLGEIAHVRHLEGDSATLHEIAEFVDALA